MIRTMAREERIPTGSVVYYIWCVVPGRPFTRAFMQGTRRLGDVPAIMELRITISIKENTKEADGFWIKKIILS